MSLHDVLHTLIDVAAGNRARLSPDDVAGLHDQVAADEAAGGSLGGPDVSPEPGDSGSTAQPRFDAFTPADAPPPAGPGA